MKLFKFVVLIVLNFLLLSCQSDESKIAVKQCQQHYKAESYSVAARVCEKAADSGEMNSQWLMANLHLNKLFDSANDTVAVQWLEKAANSAHTAAQRELGLSYWRGRGVDRDSKEALEWFRLAARQNDVKSEFYIGVVYLDGGDRDSDPASALTWFKRAASKGHKMAINNIAWIYATSHNPSLRNGERAVKLITPLVSEQPESAIFADTLAAAYAETEQFKLAVKYQVEAIRLLADQSNTEMVEGFKDRLMRYKENQPWREPHTN